MAYSGPKLFSGVSGQILATIPEQWSKDWFRNFCLGYLQYADVRNATGAGGITVSGSVGTNATIKGSGVTGLANPTANVGLSAVNGSATTAMRSDGAPALDQSIAPSWTGTHTFTPGSGVAAAFGQTITITGSQGLAAAYGSTIAIAAGLAGSKSRLYIGDGSGWAFNIAKRTGSADTDLFTFTDGGNLTVSGTLTVNGSAATLTTGVKVATSTSNTMAFYGVTPVAQRATTSLQHTSNLSTVSGTISVSTAAVNQIVSTLQEVMKTLNAYGLWGTI